MTRIIIPVAIGLTIGIVIGVFALMVVTLPATVFSTPCDIACHDLRTYYRVEAVYTECVNNGVFYTYWCDDLAQAIIVGSE